MVRCVQRRCFAGAILALVFVLLAAQNTKAQGSANSVQCGNHEASQLLQRGHDMFPKSGYGLPPVVASAGRALTYFELAAEKDPSCAQAQVALAKAEIGFPSWPGLPERFQMVKEAAMRAIELQDGLAEAHALLGDAEFNTWQWQPAEKEYKRAIELAPNDPSNHLRYARFLAAMGRPAQAVDEAEKARALAHGSPPVDLAAGEIYYWTRRYDKAVELIRPAVGSNPMGNFLLGWACAGQSNWQDAINAFATILPITDRDAGDLMSLAYAYASEGRRTDVLPMLEEAKQKTTLMYVPLYRIAATYLAMGDRKQALEWLEKAATEDPGWVVWIKVDPAMDPLRSDPRFQKLVEEMKFPSQARN